MYEAYNRKLLRVNLTDRTYKIEEIPAELIERYVGGMGLGTYYLTREVAPEADPLSEDNKLVFALGPLSGTGAPLFAQTCLVTKSPLTGGVINNYCGGDFSQAIKSTGFDVIIFEGKAEELSYVHISPDEVRFVSCPDLKGATVNATEDRIKEKEGAKATAAIGLAGENEVRFSSIISATRVFGRGGNGAVMGSKNLKGFGVEGNVGVKVHDPERFQEKVDEAFARFKKATDDQFNLLGVFSRYGTGGGMSLINEKYSLATRNHKKAHFDRGDKIDSYAYHKIGRTRRVACIGCPVHCGQLHYFEKGPNAGEFTRGPEYETMYSLGSDCCNDDPDVLAKAHDLCEKYGMDTLSAGCTIAFAMECMEKGILKEEDVGFALEFGENESIITALEKMARREGVGDLLADGSRVMSQKLGQGSENFAMNVKGMEFAAWMPQRMTGIALTFATSNRGACHKRAPIGAELMGGMPMESIEGKAQVVKEIQDTVNAQFTLVSCRFADFELPLDLFVELLNAATGMNKDNEEFVKIGERIWNLERSYNLASGMDKEDDLLPGRCFEPIEVEGEEKAMHREDFMQMLAEYYEVRGWDENGVPREEKLVELGVELPWK